VPNDAPITVLYTSGTTSAPKGVVASHLAICMDSLGTALDTRMTDADRITAMLPLFHTAQLNALYTPVIVEGGSIVILREFSLMFGQTEMSPVAAFFRPEHQLSHPGAVCRAL
jgi:long-subunit acyl-CoA synthetase (AMP-forming)